MAKVCLIKTPMNAPSEKYRMGDLGILVLASKLISKGHSVKIIPGYYEFNETVRETTEKIKETEIVGISCLTHNYNAARKIASLCKKLNENVLVVLGGPHVTWTDTLVLKENPSVDIVMRGEGENSLLEIADNFDKKKSFENIRGISIRKEGKIIQNGFAKLQDPIEGLNQEVLENYLQKVTSRFKSIDFMAELSRGCPYNCRHCAETSIVGKKYRLKNLNVFYRELEILNRFSKKIGHIFFCDSNFNASLDRLKCIREFLKTIKKEFNFVINLRADMMNKEYTKSLKKTNIGYICFGIEHFHPRVLKIDNKSSSFKVTLKACQNCKNEGIRNNINFIVGLPGDNVVYSTYSYIRARYLFKKRVTDSVEAGTFVPYPGTPFFHRPEKYGIRVHAERWEDYNRNGYPIISYESFNRAEIWCQYLLFYSLPYLKEFEKKKDVLLGLLESAPKL